MNQVLEKLCQTAFGDCQETRNIGVRHLAVAIAQKLKQRQNAIRGFDGGRIVRNGCGFSATCVRDTPDKLLAGACSASSAAEGSLMKKLRCDVKRVDPGTYQITVWYLPPSISIA